MSWNVSLIGTPSKICRALEEESGNLTGQSKVEFDSALPALQDLVNQNFHADEAEPVVSLEASGHGFSRDEEQVQRSLSVKLGRVGAKILV